MSRQAKIIIFSCILLFSWYYKNYSTGSSDLNSDLPSKSKPRKSPKTNKKGSVIYHPQPKNGFSPYDIYFGKGIYNNASGNAFKLKNSNKTDAVVLLVDAFSGRKIRNEFINRGSSFEMTGVPNGTYYLEWFSGTNWSPNLNVGSNYKGGFQSEASFTKTKDSSDWMKVEGYQEWTVTLYSVAGGDVESEKINAKDFFN